MAELVELQEARDWITNIDRNTESKILSSNQLFTITNTTIPYQMSQIGSQGPLLS